MIGQSSSEARKPRVFVSYVREDQNVVDRLAKELSAYGIKVWLDKTELKPGYRWKDAIREAISEGDFFVACFSEAYERRSKSYMNEELTLAIEELRQRPTERAWFIPVLLSECQVPARSIGAGETLRDIQWVELYRNWEEGIARIAAVIDPEAKIAQPPRVWQLDDSEWLQLIAAVSYGEFVPILGSGVNYGVVPAEAVLVRGWARSFETPEWIGLPFAEVAEHIAQIKSWKFMATILLEEYARVQFHEFNLPGEPHAVLSRLPCSMFITACIDTFMEDALTTQGKKPRSVVVKRGQDYYSFPEEIPTVSEPWVFHAFGRIDVPKSMVITVHDHMRLLQTDVHKAWPLEVQRSVGEDSLMWLGFASETIEHRTMSSLVTAHRHLYRDTSHPQFFTRTLEMDADRRGRRRILLRDFMAELQSRWEQTGKQG